MPILSINDLSYHYTGEIVLKNINMQVEKGDKIGFIGKNGSGKTTLFNLITKDLALKKGNIYMSGDVKIGYLHQSESVSSKNTVFEEALDAFSDVLMLEKEIHDISDKISHTNDEVELKSLILKQDKLNQKFLDMQGPQIVKRTEGILKGLGFRKDKYDLEVVKLSGGQKTRLALTKLLLRKPDILLLDEPTNHLDLDSRAWLENHLKDYKNALLVISHDRFFLDAVVNKIAELENSNLSIYDGNYTRSRQLKKEKLTAYQNAYKKQQQRIDDLQDTIKTLKQFNREKSLKRARSFEKKLNKLDILEKNKESGNVKINFSNNVKHSNDILKIENLKKSYLEVTLFENLNMSIYKGDRVFVLGPNGTGKSTLLKIINGFVSPDKGLIEIGKNIRFGYFDQEHERLDPDSTIYDEIYYNFPDLNQTEIRSALALMLFTDDDYLKKVKTLSGGERSKIALLKLMLSDLDFIILDEPTNHLDIESREELEDALNRYKGSLLCVSHDRYFIKKLANKILYLSKDGYSFYPYGYESYLKKRENYASNQNKQNGKDDVTKSKKEYLNMKKKASKTRKAQTIIDNTKKDIKIKEKKLDQIDQKIDDANKNSNHEKLADYYKQKEHLEDSLLSLYEKLEKTKKYLRSFES